MKKTTGPRGRAFAVLTAMLAAGVAAACGTGEAEEPTSLQTVAVQRGDLRLTAEATGTVEPIRKVEVKSKAGGEILGLEADVGDQVSRGTLLATIDPRDVRNRHEQAQADLAVAQDRADIAANQLQRQRQLRESGVITEQELESARLEQSNAEAALVRARAALELAELQLEDVSIRAPMDGTILEKNVEEGQVIQSASGNVSGGTTLFIMANLDQMQVRTMVDETDMGEIQAGMDARVTVEAYPDRTFQGRVEKVEPQAVVQQNVTMFPVIVNLDNRTGLLRPGMNAEVEVLIDQAHDVLLVPNGAIVQPQDVGPAAMALGLEVDQLELASFRGGGMGMSGRPGGQGAAGARGGPPAGEGAGARPGGPPTDRAADAAAEGGDAAGAGGVRARVQAVRDSIQGLVEAGEIDQDSARTLIRGRLAEARGAMGAGGPFAAGPAAGGDRQTRRAVVFVVDSAGTPAPRTIEIGLNDWDFTQVVSGLEEGDELAVVGAAQLQAQQQEFMNRVRSRRGGPF